MTNAEQGQKQQANGEERDERGRLIKGRTMQVTLSRESLRPMDSERRKAAHIALYVASSVRSREYDWDFNSVVNGVMAIMRGEWAPRAPMAQPRVTSTPSLEGVEIDGRVACMRDMVRPARGDRE
jgi:hypothetical protein